MISLFTHQKPFRLQNITGDIQGEAVYHFDAIVRYRVTDTARYTSYPIEFGADIQDHAYNVPIAVTVFGFTGSKELRISLNQLPELGASAVIGNINNPVLSAAAGIFAAEFGFLSGSKETRGAATLDFLKILKDSFTTFDVVTNLTLIKNLKIDEIHTDVTPENETGLEFVIEMSQLLYNSVDESESVGIDQVADVDNALLQSTEEAIRGRISFG